MLITNRSQTLKRNIAKIEFIFCTECFNMYLKKGNICKRCMKDKRILCSYLESTGLSYELVQFRIVFQYIICELVMQSYSTYIGYGTQSAANEYTIIIIILRFQLNVQHWGQLINLFFIKGFTDSSILT